MYDDLIRELELCPDAEYGCSRCEHRVSLHCRESLMKQAADAIEELQKSVKLEYQSGFADGQISANRRKNRWISVEERLPEDEKDVLSFYDDGAESRIMPANYGHGIWFDCLFNREVKGKYITHWMPLPEPPKGVSTT